jgi:hypothetical protein
MDWALTLPTFAIGAMKQKSGNLLVSQTNAVRVLLVPSVFCCTREGDGNPLKSNIPAAHPAAAEKS